MSRFTKYALLIISGIFLIGASYIINSNPNEDKNVGFFVRSMDECKIYADDIDISCMDLFSITQDEINNLEKILHSTKNCRDEYGNECKHTIDGLKINFVGAFYFKSKKTKAYNIAPVLLSNIQKNAFVLPSHCPVNPGKNIFADDVNITDLITFRKGMENINVPDQRTGSGFVSQNRFRYIMRAAEYPEQVERCQER